MKRLLLISCLSLALLPALAQSVAADCLTIGENDTLQVPRSSLGGTLSVDLCAHFTVRWDNWILNMTYPSGMVPAAVAPGSDLAVRYLGPGGTEQEYTPPISATSGFSVLSCSLEMVQGYWDQYGTGSYTSYGSVKWEPGDYASMCVLTLSISEDFTIGKLVIDGMLKAGRDYREWSNGRNGMFYKEVTFILQTLIGDVDCDGKITIGDVAELIDLLLSGEPPQSEAVQHAADVDRDGYITIADVADLIDLILNAV